MWLTSDIDKLWLERVYKSIFLLNWVFTNNNADTGIIPSPEDEEGKASHLLVHIISSSVLLLSLLLVPCHGPRATTTTTTQDSIHSPCTFDEAHHIIIIIQSICPSLAVVLWCLLYYVRNIYNWIMWFNSICKCQRDRERESPGVGLPCQGVSWLVSLNHLHTRHLINLLSAHVMAH